MVARSVADKVTPYRQCPECLGHGWRLLDMESFAKRMPLWAQRITAWAVPCHQCDGRRVIPADTALLLARERAH